MAEEARLESVYTSKAYPEFESRSLRSKLPQRRDVGFRHPFYTFGKQGYMCTSDECISKLRENMPHIKKEYGVTGLYLFGSMARGDNRPDSDVDILVDMPPKIFLVSALKEYLEKLLNVSVDLVRRHSHLSTHFLSQIANDAIPIF